VKRKEGERCATYRGDFGQFRGYEDPRIVLVREGSIVNPSYRLDEGQLMYTRDQFEGTSVRSLMEGTYQNDDDWNPVLLA